MASKRLIKKGIIKFQKCDVVFVKLKGHPKWPAQIHNVEGNTYTVVYFGTYE